MKIYCQNINDFLEIDGDKCPKTACVHNDQSVKFGCLQIMVGRKSLPIDIQHHYHHDRKRKAAVMRMAEAKLAVAGRIFRKIEDASYREYSLQKALEQAWLIYPEKRNLLGESPRIIKLLPCFMSFIQSFFWIDIFNRHYDEIEKVGWQTPSNCKELKSLFDVLPKH